MIQAMFVLTGTVTTLLGPILPVLVAWWGLDDAEAGLLFTLQFAGSMSGSALSSVAMTRLGFRPTLVIGNGLMAAGVGGLGWGVQSVGSVSVFCYGVGLGLTIPATNLVVAETHPATRASALNLLNLAWGLGAVAGPPAVALFQRTNDVDLFLYLLAGALALTATVIGWTVPAGSARRTPEGMGIAAPSRVPRAQVLLFGAMLFIYVGTETSLAGWLAVYARRIDLMSAAAASAAPAIFWTGLLLGRASAPLILRRVTEVRLLVCGLLVATASVLILLGARSPAALVTAVILGGLGLSTIFPISVALFSRDLGEAASRSAGPVFVLAALGGATLPSLVGVVSSRTGSLTAGLVIPLVGCVSMLGLQSWRSQQSRRSIALVPDH